VSGVIFQFPITSSWQDCRLHVSQGERTLRCPHVPPQRRSGHNLGLHLWLASWGGCREFLNRPFLEDFSNYSLNELSDMNAWELRGGLAFSRCAHTKLYWRICFLSGYV